MLLPLPFDITVHFLHKSTCIFKKNSEICKNTGVLPHARAQKETEQIISAVFLR